MGSPALQADSLPAELPEYTYSFFFFFFLNEGYFHFVTHSRKGFEVKKTNNNKKKLVFVQGKEFYMTE